MVNVVLGEEARLQCGRVLEISKNVDQVYGGKKRSNMIEKDPVVRVDNRKGYNKRVAIVARRSLSLVRYKRAQ